MEHSPGSTAQAGAGGGTSQGAATKRVHGFHWSQQSHRVLEQLRALYSDQKVVGNNGLGVQPDVVLFGSDGRFVEAHKMVLALCSPYFQDLFKKINDAKPFKGKDGPAVVMLASVTSSQLKHLIQLIYTGEAAVCSEQMEDFLETGSACKIDGIMYSATDPAHFPTTDFAPDTNLDPNCRDAQVLDELNVVVPLPYSSLKEEENLMDVEDMDADVNYGSYPLKVELATEDPATLEHEQDPLAPDIEDQSVSTVDPDKLDDNDSTFLASSAPAKPPNRKGKLMWNCSETTVSKKRARSNPPIVWKWQGPVSDATLKLNWSIKRQNQGKSQSSIFYYCKAGEHRCPARLKKTTNWTGIVTWENNNQEHSHPGPPEAWKLTRKQKPPDPDCESNGQGNDD